MKRNVLSLVIALALCLNICPVRALAAGDDTYTVSLAKDEILSSPRTVTARVVIKTNEFTLTSSGSTAILVTGTGSLELSGNINSKKGAGVEVQSGGSLTTMPGVNISGTTYAVEIASGAEVHLAAGTYIGMAAAISTEDHDFAALLADGYAYFGENGDPIRPENITNINTIIIGPCTHPSKEYTPSGSATTHKWTCPYCGTEEKEKCSFTFDANGVGTCSICGQGLTITVDETSLNLIYDGTDKTANVIRSVTLDGGTPLTENTHYTVSYSTRKDVGEITVTVTGVTFEGTFSRAYQVEQDEPEITWDESTKELEYDGTITTILDKLPGITIRINSTEDLHPQLKYSYRTQGTSDPFKIGLPKDAGTYEVKASLPASQNYKAAETNPCLTLTINKIDPITAPPAATKPVFNYKDQALVTAGTLDSRAVGAKILFATSQAGPYSETIPTGLNAGSYNVWYKVEGTDNYNAAGPTQINDVKIQRKEIIPNITLSGTSFVHDGSKHEPIITVKDGTTEIGQEGQYTVTWKDDKDPTAASVLTDVGTYTATIKSVNTGNYTFEATRTVEITPAAQGGLTITGKRDHVYYGDSFTLDTTGGTGDGTVAWSVAPQGAGTGVTIDGTGVLTVHGTGTFKVTAKRTVPNYGDVSDEWTFTVEPKPVTAVVTVTPKTYDGTTKVTTNQITAEVETNDLVNGDSAIEIYGVKGTYDTPNVGTNKTVTLFGNVALESGVAEKYAISYPATTTGDINRKNVAVTVTLSDHDLKTDSTVTPPGYYYNFDGAEKKPAVTVKVSGETTELAASDYTVTYANNKNVGTATVTVKNAAGGNYTFSPETVNFEIRSAGAVLTKAPQAKDLTYIKGTAQELVDVGTADGGMVVYSLVENDPAKPYSTTIPKGTDAGTYTVYYKVQGDANHSDTAPAQVSVTIKPKEFTPVITLSQDSYEYNGNAHEPAATVKDGTDVIAAGEYTVSYRDNVSAGTATAVISDNNGGNYIVNGTATFQITKAAPTVTVPTAKTGLYYTGAEQALVNAGVCNDGTVVYSVNGGSYSAALPTASARGTYTIDWKVLGDANHNDKGPETLIVNIDKNQVTNPTISLSSDRFPYNGQQQRPVITVYDKSGRVIPEHEYTVAITGTGSSDPVAVGTYTITITPSANSNYEITGNCTKTFEIVAAGQETLSITNTRGQVYYGDVIQLDTAGGTSGGTVTWKIEGNTASTLSSAGLLTVKDVGSSITVKATLSRDNYADVTATWTFTAAKKPVTAVLTGDDKNYDGNTNATVKAEVAPGDLVFGDTFNIPNLNGTFDNANVGTNKTITITSSAPSISDAKAANYEITYPKTATASIRAVPATVTTAPTAVSLTYDASKAQALLATAGAANGGDMVYSLDGTNFTRTIPTGKDAGTYTVSYKAQGDSNHTDSAVGSVKVTIGQQTVTPSVELNPPSAQYTGNVQRPQVTVREIAGNLIPDSEYTVVYETATNWKDKGNHTVTVKDVDGGNYIVNQETATFTISETVQSPLSITGRPAKVQYGDAPFTLTAVGGSGTGSVTWESNHPDVASIDGNGVVTIKKAGSVKITATREADTNHAEVSVDWAFTVEQKPVTATLTLTSGPFSYTGSQITPLESVTVEGRTLGTGEYSVSYSNNTDAGTAKVTVTSTTACNYQFSVEKTFEIAKSQAVFSTAPAGKTLTYNGSAHELVSTGTTADGHIEYQLNGGGYSGTVPMGTNAGTYTVEFKVVGDSNHTESEVGTALVTIQKAAASYSTHPAGKTLTYNGGDQELVTAGSTTNNIGTVVYSLTEAGSYTADIPKASTVGTYTVWYKVEGTSNYEGINAASVEAKIDKATPTITTNPTASGTAGQPLSNFTLTGGIASVPGSFSWTNGETVVAAGTPYEVTFKPTDTANYNTATCSVTPVPASSDESGGGTGDTPSADISTTPATNEVSMSMPASVKNGAANAALSTADGTKLVKAAAAKRSPNVVIKPKITEDVTKAEVSIPASTFKQITDETSADLTVSTPIADTTISREALETLGQAGGTVSVAAEQADQGVTVTLTANGQQVDSVPGGLTVTVPVEETKPGTVAVLVHEDGTRETIRKSVASDGKVNIPLDGSATVEIVDNSKEFEDVQPTDWAADAVAFASAHELFNGTSETTFSPEEDASRGMLATVLYNLEGRPEQDVIMQDLDSGYSDVNGDAWYAEGVAWAAKNGIVNGYGNGQFGPDDSITREQLVVMLWKYAGSPEAGDQALGFTDADQASEYAREALRWAVEKGILNGYGNGSLVPGGTATRAEAAQMLKNFMERA